MTAHTKNLSDTMAISDSLTKAVAKPIADSVSIREPFCVPITIDHTKVAGDLTDFVFPINERDLPASFWLAVQADGLNIAVYDGATKLKRQVAYINKTTEVLEVYVRVPSLSSSVDTVLTLCAGTTEYSDDADTWPATWVFVSDMSDYNAGTQIRDWSQYGNHGTKGAGAAAPTEVAGVVGMAQSFDGTAQYISVPDAALTAKPLTMSVLWQRQGASGDGVHHALFRKLCGLNINLIVDADGTSGQAYALDSSFRRAFFSGLNALDWHNLGAVIGDTVDSCVDGMVTTGDAIGVVATTTSVGIGTTTIYQPNGLICEARLSSVARTADEIATDDASLRGTATFYSVGTGVAGIARAIGKPESDTVTIADSPSKGIGKPLSDSVAIADAIVKEMGLGKSDTLAITDALVKDVGLNKADTMTISDVLSKALGKPLSDSIAITDALSKAVGIIEHETMAIADSLVKQVGLGKADTVAITDALSKAMSKDLADAIAIVDSMVMTGSYARPGINVAAFLYARAINSLLYNRDINAKSRREF